ncbi:hypothetical protein SAMN05444392_106132 [Seinonella peptonophila]|uniref:Phosphotransferase enzyme family protein n=1 Tax=Seinonella peptonophila TaxID=112248 RepID=A0A1M4YAC4_9BACL|nr:hypothetical protein [Seinonella peptonophila]SHF02704.1 hypothetical protein SAMN05444392_106132 [Seinonella peptonophila]
MTNHQAFMLKQLTKAAVHFDVSLKGKLVYGWRDRTIGSEVWKSRQAYWLRLVSESIHWVNKEWWESNITADAIQGIPKPRVLELYRWREDDICYQAELMERATGKVCSSTPELREMIELPNDWWINLRQSLDHIAAHSTQRIKVTQEKISQRFRDYYGNRVDSQVTHWTTAHGDFHWGNLMAPQLCILDWEGWGIAPGCSIPVLF